MITIFDRITGLKDKPTVHNKVHESIYRCWDVVGLIHKMLIRDDSRATIIEFIEWYLRTHGENNITNSKE